MSPYEVPPASEDPDLDRCVLLCERCAAGARGGGLVDIEWRFLDEAVWTELPPVQVVAVRLLHRLSAAAPWAAATLDGLYLDPDVKAWSDAGDIP